MVNPGLEMPINCPIESGKSNTVTAWSVASNLNLLRISSYVMITLGTTARTFAAITSAKASAVYCPTGISNAKLTPIFRTPYKKLKGGKIFVKSRGIVALTSTHLLIFSRSLLAITT
jgi:hypothetical protein